LISFTVILYHLLSRLVISQAYCIISVSLGLVQNLVILDLAMAEVEKVSIAVTYSQGHSDCCLLEARYNTYAPKEATRFVAVSYDFFRNLRQRQRSLSVIAKMTKSTKVVETSRQFKF
jgi:hypothetical protein